MCKATPGREPHLPSLFRAISNNFIVDKRYSQHYGAPTRINNNYQFVGGASAPNRAATNLMNNPS
jgi:hypothetical protein